MSSYSAKHHIVRRVRGSATLRSCLICGAPAQQWAQIHGTSGDDVADYASLCIRCHRAYDEVGAKASAKQKGRPRGPQSAEWVERRAKGIQNADFSRNKSGVPGVHFHKNLGKWRVQVRRVHGGVYAKFEDAVTARDALASALYGPDTRQYGRD